MKLFPWEFIEKKEILFYPDPPELKRGDILEIGPGRGDLLFAMAQELPDKRIVAVELGNRRYAKLIQRVEKRGFKNIQLIHADARIALQKFYVHMKFEKIYVLFPDPWPKSKHVQHRLLNREFISLIAERLQPNGSVYFATDVKWYASWAIENALCINSLANQGDPFTTAEALYKYTPTNFEQKWRVEGRHIYYMHFIKQG